MSPLLQVEELAVAGVGEIVRPTSLDLSAGRAFTILGETGSGKTLLAQAIMGTLPAGLRASGRIRIHGAAVQDWPLAQRRALWGREVAMLPQEPWLALDPTMRVLPQVAEGHRHVRGRSSGQARAAARDDLLALGLEAAAGRLPGQLSGGMAQRVAFAAARAGGAGLLIADEPTKGLDADRRDEVAALLRREVEAGGGLLTITHDIQVARLLGGEVAIMHEGRLVERGPARELLSRPASDYARRLLAADPTAWPSATPAPVGDEVLRVEDLAIARGGRLLFEGLGFTAAAGEVIGVTGPSGCGKSTLGDLCLGLLAPTRGVVQRNPALARLRYQKLYQDPPAAFPPHATLGQSVNDVVARHRLDPALVDTLLRRLRLDPALLARHPRSVSGGELQRLAILRVLLLAPVFLFADEPTSRLDTLTQQETIGLLTELARERGCALLLVSHDRTLVDRVADRRIGIRPESPG